MQVSDFSLQYSWRNSKKIPYLNYVRRGIQLTPLFLYKMVACVVSVTAIITCINCISPDLACFINLQYLCRLHNVIALQIAQNDANNGSLFSSRLWQSWVLVVTLRLATLPVYVFHEHSCELKVTRIHYTILLRINKTANCLADEFTAFLIIIAPLKFGSVQIQRTVAK